MWCFSSLVCCRAHNTAGRPVDRRVALLVTEITQTIVYTEGYSINSVVYSTPDSTPQLPSPGSTPWQNSEHQHCTQHVNKPEDRIPYNHLNSGYP